MQAQESNKEGKTPVEEFYEQMIKRDDFKKIMEGLAEHDKDEGKG